MIISYKWLKDYLDLELSAEELTDKLTFSGIEVESVKKIGENLDQIIIAEILEKKKHPNADNLSETTSAPAGVSLDFSKQGRSSGRKTSTPHPSRWASD